MPGLRVQTGSSSKPTGVTVTATSKLRWGPTTSSRRWLSVISTSGPAASVPSEVSLPRMARQRWGLLVEQADVVGDLGDVDLGARARHEAQHLAHHQRDGGEGGAEFVGPRRPRGRRAA